MHKFETVKNLLSRILHIIFPEYCIVCRNVLEIGEHKICDACIGKIVEVENVCLKCGNPLNFIQDWCNACSPKRIYYEKLFALYYYSDTIRFLIKQLKYKPSDETIENLEFFYSFFTSNSEIFSEMEILIKDLDFIIPVPIHIMREEKRGYNQSMLFSTILSDIFGLPVNDKIIKKIKNTRFFYKLDTKARHGELENAFEVLDKNLVYGKNILLVDDISTTGATFNNISKILLENGANSVFCFCVAHE